MEDSLRVCYRGWGAESIFGCYLFLKKKKDIRLRWALGYWIAGLLDYWIIGLLDLTNPIRLMKTTIAAITVTVCTTSI